MLKRDQKGMTSFGWKKKTGEKVSRSASAAFEEDALDEEEVDAAVLGEGEIDWLSLQQSAKRSKVIPLEDSLAKAARLKDEGAVLAEEERFWEAIKKWDAALDLKPNDETVYEMKAQTYMALSEVFPAVSAAQKAVELNPLWWIAYQTLGRAHLGLGEVRTAILQFSRAVHINPAEKELWDEDLRWAHNLWLQKQQLAKKQKEDTEKENSDSTVKITELNSDSHEGENQTKQPRHSHKLNDETLVTSTSKSKSVASEKSDDQMMHLPSGYIKMRDAT